MKKSKERRSMTYALICYSRIGGNQGCTSPFEAYKRIEGAFFDNRELALDVWAVHECLMLLHLQNDGETLKALREIYVQPFSKNIFRIVTKNEISRRILRFATENNLDERTVYRRLKKAREAWESVRCYGQFK